MSPVVGPRVERALLIVGVSVIYLLYWPINRITADAAGYDMATAIDRATPLVPGWLYVYALLFVTGYVPILVVRDRALFRRIGAAVVGLEVCSFATFLLFPVRMTLRPEPPPVDSLATWGLNFAYWADEPVNCFPSLHVAAAALAALACWKADRLVALVGLILLVAVSASTMLVKQHYLADVVSATLLVAFWYAVVIAPLDVSDRTTEELRYPRWWLLAVPTLYAVLIAVFWALYRSGWAPWES